MSDDATQSAPFLLGESGREHAAGDEGCGVCWGRYPQPCGDGCIGLMHAELGDEDSDCNYWLYTRCDVCGTRRR